MEYKKPELDQTIELEGELQEFIARGSTLSQGYVVEKKRSRADG